jgi:hypothetical protein
MTSPRYTTSMEKRIPARGNSPITQDGAQVYLHLGGDGRSSVLEARPRTYCLHRILRTSTLRDLVRFVDEFGTKSLRRRNFCSTSQEVREISLAWPKRIRCLSYRHPRKSGVARRQIGRRGGGTLCVVCVIAILQTILIYSLYVQIMIIKAKLACGPSFIECINVLNSRECP